MEADSETGGPCKPRAAVAGGGIAGLEAALALRGLTDGGLDVTVISFEPELTYRPLMVNEPFSSEHGDPVALGSHRAPEID